MHFIKALGVAIMAIAATSANPLPEAEAEPTLTLPSLWCKKWDSSKSCCVDDDKLGCDLYSVFFKKCLNYKKNYWCNTWDHGKGCCKDSDKPGCVDYDWPKQTCKNIKLDYFCKDWDHLGFFCKDSGKEGCSVWDYALKKCGKTKENYWCYNWSKDEGCCKDEDGGTKDCVKYDWWKKECTEEKKH
jgi:hypothetical protein